jgi:hypothetical protein
MRASVLEQRVLRAGYTTSSGTQAVFGVSCKEMAGMWESRMEVLQAAHEAGFSLSVPQLGRLHRAGLIASPSTRSLGRGNGTVSEFPAGTSARLLRVLELQRRKGAKNLSVIGWRLWWEDGGMLPPPARGLLEDVASSWDEQRRVLSELMARDAQGDAEAMRRTEDLYAEAESGRVSGPLGVARRNTGREGFSSVVRVITEIATGRFESYGDTEEPAEDGTPQPQTIGALVEKALGLDRARRDRIAGNEPRFSGNSEKDLATLSCLIGQADLAQVARAHDALLNEARVEVRSLMSLLRTFAPIVERTIGRDAGGYGTIAKAFARLTPRTEAFMLLSWLVLRQDPALLEGMQALVALLPQVQAMAELGRIFDQLSQAVPELAPVLSGAVRAEATGDADHAARMHAEIARLANEHREQVDRVFGEHPALDAARAAARSSP